MALANRDRPIDTPLVMAARKLSAGRRRAIPEETLARLLRDADAREVDTWAPHLRGLLEELPLESVHDLVIYGWTDFPRLAYLARRLDCEGETVDWIHEMAEFAVARPS